MLRLHDLVEQAARSAPTRTAVIFEGRHLSYAELDDRVRRLAGMLVAGGVAPGDRVAYWSPNRLEFVEFLFGTARAGGVAVPLDHWSTPEGVIRSVERCRPRVLLCGTTQAKLLAGEEERLRAAGVAHLLVLDDDYPPDWAPYQRALAEASPLAAAGPVSIDDPALILFTSGSTGTPKGAVHTHRDLTHTALIMAFELGLREGERTLHFLPLFSSCLEHLIPLTLVRGTHVIMSHFDPGRVWDLVDHEQITHIDAVPTTLTRLLEAAPAQCPPSLRVVSYASEPMPALLLRRLVEYAPDTSFVQFYGMIEHLCLAVLKPWEQTRGPGTVGKAMLGAQLRIVGDDGHDVPSGERGEVVAASPTLMSGYWEDPDATAGVIRDGWMRTGDLGHLDPDGYLVLEGRLKEVIKSGGMTVVPREVEEVLREHPDILEVAVVGVPSERWGEEVHAFVVARPGTHPEPAALIGHCHRLLAGYKCPKEVRLVHDLPRTGIGKIARRQLAYGHSDAS